MTQLRRHSLLESCLNTASGFLVSYLAWPVVCRFVLHVPFHAGSGLETIGVFTVLSVARNYLWRRVFNRGEPAPLLIYERGYFLQTPERAAERLPSQDPHYPGYGYRPYRRPGTPKPPPRKP